jgi:hypothetical protein
MPRITAAASRPETPRKTAFGHDGEAIAATAGWAAFVESAELICIVAMATNRRPMACSRALTSLRTSSPSGLA